LLVSRLKRGDLGEEVASTSSDLAWSARSNKRAEDVFKRIALCAYQTHFFTGREVANEEAIAAVDCGWGSGATDIELASITETFRG
jgi:hypothetical protein